MYNGAFKYALQGKNRHFGNFRAVPGPGTGQFSPAVYACTGTFGAELAAPNSPSVFI